MPFAPGVIGINRDKLGNQICNGMEVDDKTKWAFLFYDRNRDGYITKAEMSAVSKHLSKAQVDEIYKRIDANKDGKLSFEEFQELAHDEQRNAGASQECCCNVS